MWGSAPFLQCGRKYELIKELIAPHLNGMFVTPKDVDEMVKQISYTISEGLNLLFLTQKSHKKENLSHIHTPVCWQKSCKGLVWI